MNKFKNKYTVVSLITLVISLILIFVNTSFLRPKTFESYNKFLEDFKNKQISTVYYTDSSKLSIKLNNGKIYETDNPRNNNFKELMLKNGISVKENNYMHPIEIISNILLMLSILSLIAIVIKSTRETSKAGSSLDSLETNVVGNTGFTFDNVAGNIEAKESIKDIVDFLKSPEKYKSYGAKMPRGLILYGEPGTGKTLLAKAVAGEANVPFYAMSGSDFVQIYVGVGASRIRQLFKKARSHGKAVIFIDEIDAIGKKRSNSTAGGSDERDQTLNALLTEMSGFKETDGIVVIAATNRLDMLDGALLRPGRFDRHVEVSLPDIIAREKILNLYLKNKPYKNINVNLWAQKTAMFSGAKLEHLVNEAAILACKDNSKYIEDIHLHNAFSIVLAGYEKQDRNHIKNLDKEITAYHEAGHALISAKVLPNEKLSKVTIIPTTKGAGGYTLSIPEDKMYQSKEYLLNRIMVLLGGRAAEEIIFGKDKITTGAYSDLKHSTKLINNMITLYGMGNSLGLLTLSEIGNVSSSTQDMLINECKSTLENLYNETKSILLNNKNILENLATNLLNEETLYDEKLQQILNFS
ncbi:ATP-dependent zinc metalloprotease FtsH [Clostridium botulinum]|uniref:ATP-dependent metallopeptidase HflB n=1 Tax=Clostridium botulinum D str. 1873 TaxID=592027 RepID=A0A9P2LLD1_CLOBO|nr:MULTISPECIES: ATP-dependent metallopeptidase FtsH/Yme1/Tma family protein [Clostridium]EES91463.1 putative ATP-dependent metallopeptidase HflB [Clostridium botulinum D str. 1873]MBO3442823.1 AAA family ATPase [Clostridium haemolyticum]MCD3245198.1 ATP-dependent zinc metalloprotease FtsH [Clostridium botulinum C]MCD3260731.1 ATP-dependent zinc metalloprotease FtsH [Clostridium botulinum C]NFV47341.1 ATP-dependent zinc metalloprotease FtsH [Clostridium botulinum]